MDYLEQLITIGGPIVGAVWLLFRLHVKSEIQTVVTNLHERITTCSDKILLRVENKADKDAVEKALERAFSIMDETRAQLIDVLRDLRNERTDR